jgi:Mrp family chromosome partitioning ATPase
VDRYLYPAVSDRLLSRYEYFTHAGDKLKQAAQAGLKVLGITGVGRDEGRSTLAICLARAAARSGLKVALVDCDFQHPQLAQLIGLDVASGWESVALGEIGVAEVAIRSLDDGILLLPLLDEAKTSSLSLNDARVARILAQARQTHDVVILDAGPLEAKAATEPDLSHASPLDAAIVVWDRRRRKLDEAEAVAQWLSAAGVEAVGIAENFAG